MEIFRWLETANDAQATSHSPSQSATSHSAQVTLGLLEVSLGLLEETRGLLVVTWASWRSCVALGDHMGALVGYFGTLGGNLLLLQVTTGLLEVI